MTYKKDDNTNKICPDSLNTPLRSFYHPRRNHVKAFITVYFVSNFSRSWCLRSSSIFLRCFETNETLSMHDEFIIKIFDSLSSLNQHKLLLSHSVYTKTMDSNKGTLRLATQTPDILCYSPLCNSRRKILQ